MTLPAFFRSVSGKEILVFNSQKPHEPFTLLPPGPNGEQYRPHMSPGWASGQPGALPSPERDAWFERIRAIALVDAGQVGGEAAQKIIVERNWQPENPSLWRSIQGDLAQIQPPGAAGSATAAGKTPGTYAVGGGGGIGYIGDIAPEDWKPPAPGEHPYLGMGKAEGEPAPVVGGSYADGVTVERKRCEALLTELMDMTQTIDTDAVRKIRDRVVAGV